MGTNTTRKSFLRKLKYQYLEQKTKDMYIKAIVCDIDDAHIVAPEDLKELQALNEQKKESLKEAKARLNQKCADIRSLAPLVEQGDSYSILSLYTF
jgi:hypothetical protein